MKQFAFMVEVVINNNNDEMFFVRNPKGQIEDICYSPEELTSFFKKSIETFKNLFKNAEDGK